MHRKRGGAAAAERTAALAASKAVAKAAPARLGNDVAQSTAAARSGRRPARKTVAAAPVLPEDVQRILDVLPELRGGGAMALNLAAERLRAAQLLSRSGSSAKLFGKHPELFTLKPQRQPHTVQFGPMPS